MKEMSTIGTFTFYLEGRERRVLLEGVQKDLPGKYYYAF
jgi:hypothetical protein